MSLTLSKMKIQRMEKLRQKRLSSSLEILKHINKVPTLSERLKVAGIKEGKPPPEGKRSSTSKVHKKRKNYHKKLYLEKSISQSGTNAKRKRRNLKQEYLIPYLKESSQNEDGESPPKSTEKTTEDISENPEDNPQASAKETIFVSLDFLQDCQNYKRNVKGRVNLKSLKKKTKLKNALKKEESKSKSLSNTEIPASDRREQAKESFPEAQEGKVTNEKGDDVAKTDTILKNPNEKEDQVGYPFERNYPGKLFHSNMQTESIAKIDKKFLESLLSIATAMVVDKAKEEKENKRAEKSNEKQHHRKLKAAGKGSLEGKAQNTDPETNGLKISKGATPAPTGSQNEEKPITSYKDKISAKLTRDAAKSEVQIQPLKATGDEGSKMKSEKNMSLSKPVNEDTRKKRKNRNKILKNGNDDFVDASFPSEVSKIADVKELWRRESREKSENSLSSYSSCTVPEGEDISEWKTLGLQSYRILKKLVEEEVNKITQKSEKKDNVAGVENKENIPAAEGAKDEESPNTNFNKLMEPLGETLEIAKKAQAMKVNEILNAQRISRAVRKRQQYSVYEGRKKSQLSSLLEDPLKRPKEKLQLLEEAAKKGEKVPSAVVNNWSILNRLEQAFLVLGTPTFNNNKDKKHSNALEYKHSKGDKKTNPSPEKLQEVCNKKVKRSRSKEALIKKKNAKDPAKLVGNAISKSQDSSIKSISPNKKNKTENRQNVLKEKREGNKTVKEIMYDHLPVTSKIFYLLKDEENMLKREKKTPKQTPDGPHTKKTGLNSPERMKTKRDKESGIPHEHAKAQEVSKFASKVLKSNQNHEKKSGVKLERKKTFNVIQTKETTVIQPRKSKSCNKIDSNCDLEGVKICFSQTKTPENLRGKAELTRRMETEAAKRTLKKMAKSLTVKEKLSQSNERPKSTIEKDSRGNREGSVKTPRARVVQEKKCEKLYPTEDLPQQILARKELNRNTKKRAIKERSILSMRASQHEVQEQIKELPNIQENPESVSPEADAENTVETYRQDADVDSDLFPHNVIENYSNVSTSTFDVADTNEQNKNTETCVRLVIREFQEEDPVEDAEAVLSSSSLSSHVFGKRQSVLVGIEKTEINPLKKHQLWEKDINYYHTVVREILSHYKRIDGFLKQTEYYDSFSSSLVNPPLRSSEMGEEPTAISNNLDNLQEYRKKVMYEYQVLPFCEYKSKLQERSDEAKKRNLQVVKDLKADMDSDVKDFRLNIQKVLDSQLYVDADLMVKRTETETKFKDKNSSLQALMLCKNEKPVVKQD